jgi:hypothetical protein
MLFFPVCLGLQGGPFPSNFLTRTLYAFLVFPLFATCPYQLILLDLIILITCGEDRLLLKYATSSIPSPFTSFPFRSTYSSVHSVQFQFLLVFMDLPDDIVKFRNDGGKHSLVLGHCEQGMNAL